MQEQFKRGWTEVNQGLLYFEPQFFTVGDADRYFKQLSSTLDWQQHAIQIYGRQVLQPRLQAWCGDVSYRYSGLTLPPSPWTNDLLDIKTRIETVAKQGFNSVLANYYRDGQDYMGWHKDNEKELGMNPIVASVSFGATRRFLLRHAQSNQKIEFLLEHGSLLIMAGALQHHWYHSLPKTTKVLPPRINLTFRNVVG